MGVAGEGVRDQNGVRAVGIQMAVGFVGDFDRGQSRAALQRDTVETGTLGFNNHRRMDQTAGNIMVTG